MTRLVAVDPGSEFSAWLLYDDATGMPVDWGKIPNAELLGLLDDVAADVMAIEMVASYGMAVGATVFETCVWAGRFIERWLASSSREPERVYRREVKMLLCGTNRAKDANIRQALIDRYGPGKEKAVGLKSAPGPLYGLKSDCWAALGVAITAVERTEQMALVE
jgi:hypothetical protein